MLGGDQTPAERRKREKLIYQTLTRKHGLQVAADAIAHLVASKASIETIDELASHCVGTMTLQSLQEIIASLNESSTVAVSVVDTFNVPTYVVNGANEIRVVDKKSRSLLADAGERVVGWRVRYDLLRAKMARHPSFRSLSITSSGSALQITPILHLKGKPPGPFLLFGLLTTIDSRLHLEDPDATIPVTFAKGFSTGPGVFTCGCFALAQGVYGEDEGFEIEVLAMPFPETRVNSISSLAADTNLFGAPLVQPAAPPSTHVVLISDLHLDKPPLLASLATLLSAFTPAILILIGNFQSTPFVATAEGARVYREGFDALAKVVDGFAGMVVVVPGPGDAGGGGMLPRAGIPRVYTKKLRAKVKNIHFPGNPCRIKLYGQEMVIFRHDILSSLTRAAILPPTADTPLSTHALTTVIDQCHLLPLFHPIYATHQSAMRLFPNPDVLVLADRAGLWTGVYEGVKGCNPGGFGGGDFMVYDVEAGEFEPSKIG